MNRLIVCILLAGLSGPTAGWSAEPSSAEIKKVLAVQQAMTIAREHLRKNQQDDAARVLEAELVNANGNPQFLTLLHDTYASQLKSLQLARGETTKIEELRQRIRILEGASATPAKITELPTENLTTPKAKIVPPPIPAAPEVALPTDFGPAPIAAPTTESTGESAKEFDPFQQEARTEPGTAQKREQASLAFASKQYAEASSLFAMAVKNKEVLTVEQRDEWAYSRLYEVARRLNLGTETNVGELTKEVEEATKMGSKRIAGFGQKLLNTLGKLQPTKSPKELGEWEIVASGSFRIFHHGLAERANEVASVAVAARTAMYERWASAPAGEWTPKCDIYLHESATAYASTTGKSSENPGHSAVGIKGGSVVSRRIDLHDDDVNLLDDTLPFEVTQVVLTDLFADQPLPKWALVGMAALSESPKSVARYRRSVGPMLKEQKLFEVAGFMEMTGFPDAANITPFYAESISLVSYLVELRGAKAFTTFLREAPRRGYGKVLQTHYELRDGAELQSRWMKTIAGSPRE